jgi:hypothetical protein
VFFGLLGEVELLADVEELGRVIMLSTVDGPEYALRRFICYFIGIIVLGLLTTTFGARATGLANDVAPGMTEDWWQWALSIPTSVHPLRNDPTGTPPPKIDPSSDFCMVGQHGKLWYLGGTFLQVDLSPNAVQARSGTAAPQPDVTRTCTIPYGKSILVPVLNSECNTAEEIQLGNLRGDETYLKKVDYLRNCARGQANAITTARASFGRKGGGSSALNVKRVATLLPFAMTYAPDHILQFGTPWVPKVNPSLAFSDGYWALIPPPPPGDYELNTFGNAPSFNFSLRIKYILTIVGPR